MKDFYANAARFSVYLADYALGEMESVTVLIGISVHNGNITFESIVNGKKYQDANFDKLIKTTVDAVSGAVMAQVGFLLTRQQQEFLSEWLVEALDNLINELPNFVSSQTISL